MNAVDLFAGAGGWSHGWRIATGSDPLLAVDHCPHAVQVHSANHPGTEHFLQDVWSVDPAAAVAGRSVDWLHGSPDCRHFSRAMGSKPREDRIRGLAWVLLDWAHATRPQFLSLENVPEFKTWGPLDDEGHPIKARAGETFAVFVAALRSLGYAVDWRVLCAADFGAPTIRRRLFLVGRRDGLPIRWPEPTHADPSNRGMLQPWRTAAECIDWAIPCPSIFGRKRPLAPATRRRIDEGIVRFVQQKACSSFLMQYYSSGGQHSSVDAPLPAVVTKARHSLVTVAMDGAHPVLSAIGMRMLAPRELARAQGFPDSYVLNGTTEQQIARVGNSVVPQVAAAIVRANLGLEACEVKP